MKGERTLIDQPFRYGGIMHNYDKDVEQFGLAETRFGKRCWCCGGRPMNCYSSRGTLLKYNYQTGNSVTGVGSATIKALGSCACSGTIIQTFGRCL